MSSVNAANSETVTLPDQSTLPQQPTLSPTASPTTTASEPPASPEQPDDLRHDEIIITTEPSTDGRSSDAEKMLDSAMDGALGPDTDPGNEPLILMNAADGTEHMATDDSQQWTEEESHELKRVKVYELEGARWADRGTAFCFGDFQDNEALLIARSEADYHHIILRTTIRAHDVYQRQQGEFLLHNASCAITNLVPRYIDRVD